MANIPEDKWQCPGCKAIYANDEEDDDGEDNEDYADQCTCSECDTDDENPYCADCALYFEESDIVICPTCLEDAMKDTKNLIGRTVERIVEKIVEKPVYITTNGQATNTTPEETMEEFERRIVGMP